MFYTCITYIYNGVCTYPPPPPWPYLLWAPSALHYILWFRVGVGGGVGWGWGGGGGMSMGCLEYRVSGLISVGWNIRQSVNDEKSGLWGSNNTQKIINKQTESNVLNIMCPEVTVQFNKDIMLRNFSFPKIQSWSIGSNSFEKSKIATSSWILQYLAWDLKFYWPHVFSSCSGVMSNLVMDDLRWYTILIVKFQMYTCDAGDGSFTSYVNEYQHWTFPKHNHNRFFSLSTLIREVESWQPQMQNDFSRQIFLHHFIGMLYATTYVICSYLVQSTREVRS